MGGVKLTRTILPGGWAFCVRIELKTEELDAVYEIIRIPRRSPPLNVSSCERRRRSATENYPNTEALFDAMLLTSAPLYSSWEAYRPGRSLHLCVSVYLHRYITVVHIPLARHLRGTLPLNLTEGFHNTTFS